MDGPPWLRFLSAILGGSGSVEVAYGYLTDPTFVLSFHYLIIGIALIIFGLVALLRSYFEGRDPTTPPPNPVPTWLRALTLILAIFLLVTGALAGWAADVLLPWTTIAMMVSGAVIFDAIIWILSAQIIGFYNRHEFKWIFFILAIITIIIALVALLLPLYTSLMLLVAAATTALTYLAYGVTSHLDSP